MDVDIFFDQLHTTKSIYCKVNIKKNQMWSIKTLSRYTLCSYDVKQLETTLSYVTLLAKFHSAL